MASIPITTSQTQVLSPSQIYALARSVGCTPAQAIVATAIALAESGGNALIKSPQNSDGSYDRGLWQINSDAHSEIGDSCAYDAVCNAHAMYAISHRGTYWKPWSTYNNGKYTKWLTVAKNAQSSTNDIQTQQTQTPVTGTPSNDTGTTIFDNFTKNVVLLLVGGTCVLSGILLIFHPDINEIVKKGAEIASL